MHEIDRLALIPQAVRMAGRRRVVFIIWLVATGATATWAPFKGGSRHFIFFPGHGTLDSPRLFTEWVAIGTFCGAVLLLLAGRSIRRPRTDVESLGADAPSTVSKRSRWLYLPLSVAYHRLRWRLAIIVALVGLIPVAAVLSMTRAKGSQVPSSSDAPSQGPTLASAPPLGAAVQAAQAQADQLADAVFGPPVPLGWTRKGILLISNSNPKEKIPVQQWTGALLATTLTPGPAADAARLAAWQQKALADLDAVFSDVVPGPKTYQVTGTVLDLGPDLIVVQKGKDRWEIARDAATKVTGTLKVGGDVTIEYRMTATDLRSRG